jgi:four helix bundle protein
MFAFERFDAWHRCHELTLSIYGSTLKWPKSELYGLVSQVRRAAVSAEANIAEGAAKRGRREFRRYLDISLGSLSEVACLLRIARDLGYLSAAEAAELDVVRTAASKLTWRLTQSVTDRPTA